MLTSRIPALVALFAWPIVATTTFAQADQRPRMIRIDEGITMSVAPPWRYTQVSGPVKAELIVARDGALRAAAYVTVEWRRGGSDAVQRAAEIAGPPSPEDRLFVMQGWPAVEATRRIEVPRKVEEKPEALVSTESKPAQEPEPQIFERTITAIAVRDRTVIVERRLYDLGDDSLRKAGADLLGQIRFARDGDEALSRKVLTEIEYVRKNLFDKKSAVEYTRPDFGFFFETRETAPVLAQAGQGEIAMAASADGRKVALVSNSGFASSSDYGVTYAGGTPFPASIANQGDPALAYGGWSNSFYLSYLGLPNGSGTPGNAVSGCTASVDSSANGQTYAFAGHVARCATSALPTSPLCSPDQPQIAAEPAPLRRRITRSRPDSIYVVWRQFTLAAGTPNRPTNCANIQNGNVAVQLACSTDSGKTWGAQRTLGAAGDFARVAVGPDGSVYVVYAVLQIDGGGTTWDQIMLDKYSSCRSGLVEQWGYPRTVVANGKPASCNGTVPGLDRCNGQLMNSHTVTVMDFFNGTVFVVYADGTVNGTDRIIAAMAPNGGFNVTSTYLISENVAGRKFLPWACAEGRNLYVTWYDRRAATAAAPDNTDFYAGWLRLDTYGPKLHWNINLTGNADPQCASGWPFGTTIPGNATSCPTAQPTAGQCLNAAGAQNGTCNFASPACPPTFTCSAGPGAPKYGDYNANACAAGRLFAGWTSATAPSGYSGAVLGLSTFTRTVIPKVP